MGEQVLQKCELSVEGIKEDVRALRVVSPAYAGKDGELTSVLQYVFQAIVLSENGMRELSRDIMRIASDEMRHLQLVGGAIVRLGAPPVFTACPPYPVSYYSASCVNYVRGAREMVDADICSERNAISSYLRMLDRLDEPALSALIKGICEEEEEHLALLEHWAGKL